MSTASGISFDKLCAISGVAVPVPEYQFALAIGRKWKFDFAWPDKLVALEVEGGVFMNGGGRHTRGAGFREDLQKYNVGASTGWLIIRCLPEQLSSTATMDFVRRALFSRARLKLSL